MHLSCDISTINFYLMGDKSMIDSLFDKKSAKKFDSIAHKKAKLAAQENKFVNEFMRSTSSETITSVFDVVDKFGHPEEQKLAHDLREKYAQGKQLGFDDIMTLETLYKSNYQNYTNKGDDNE